MKRRASRAKMLLGDSFAHIVKRMNDVTDGTIGRIASYTLECLSELLLNALKRVDTINTRAVTRASYCVADVEGRGVSEYSVLTRKHCRGSSEY